MTRDIAIARSVLFVPGDRPERFAKAAASGADSIILDLEDAVADTAKDEARRNVAQWLSRGNSCIVRINGASTRWYQDDVAMLKVNQCSVLVPKAENPDQLRHLVNQLPPGTPIVALVETAVGLRNADAVAGAPGVIRLALGSADLCAELGLDLDDREALAYSRSHLAMASAANQIAPPIDAVTLNLGDPASLAADCRHGLAMGFSGKFCIHPNQVETVNHTFMPSAGDIRWAWKVTRAAAGGGVTVIDGHMIDKPVIDRARRILQRIADG